jgi:hypothetical protein
MAANLGHPPVESTTRFCVLSAFFLSCDVRGVFAFELPCDDEVAENLDHEFGDFGVLFVQGHSGARVQIDQLVRVRYSWLLVSTF